MNECRAEMGKPGKRWAEIPLRSISRRMLLSMLGVNLSAGQGRRQRVGSQLQVRLEQACSKQTMGISRA